MSGRHDPPGRQNETYNKHLEKLSENYVVPIFDFAIIKTLMDIFLGFDKRKIIRHDMV